MVLAYHLIVTAYGFCLPINPRGSWSDFVWAWELRRFGPAKRQYPRLGKENAGNYFSTASPT
jgi:hypothetical protein